jgi:hypothetical protein
MFWIDGTTWPGRGYRTGGRASPRSVSCSRGRVLADLPAPAGPSSACTSSLPFAARRRPRGRLPAAHGPPHGGAVARGISYVEVPMSSVDWPNVLALAPRVALALEGNRNALPDGRLASRSALSRRRDLAQRRRGPNLPHPAAATRLKKPLGRTGKRGSASRSISNGRRFVPRAPRPRGTALGGRLDPRAGGRRDRSAVSTPCRAACANAGRAPTRVRTAQPTISPPA